MARVIKSFINRGVHSLIKLFSSTVSVSVAEKTAYLNKAKLIQDEIRLWAGNLESEKIGLGQNCNASWYLKATSNKQASYPFDWIFTTPELIIDMLNDNFAALLDKSQLIPHGADAGHERYHEWLFGHRNPASSDSDHAFLQRCVNRWNALMQSKKPIIFFTVVLNEHEKRKRWRVGFSKKFNLPKNQTPSDFIPVIDKIKSINPNCKFLFIEQYTQTKFELEVTDKTEDLLWLQFGAVGANTGVQYLHQVDDDVIKTVLKGLHA